MNRIRPPRFAHAWLLVATILFVAPLALMVLSSLKTPDQLAENPHALFPSEWRFSNYSDAMSAMPFWQYLRNSLLLAGGSVAGSLISCSMAAYAFARLEWRGRRVLFAVLIATMLLPWHVTMIPRFLLLKQLGLYNSLYALILPTLLGDAFYIFLLHQFFRSIPRELSEAALLDGLSEWGIFWRIILPLSRPALATIALFQFLAAWNDFGGPLLYLSDPREFPLAYGLERFVSSYSDQTHLLLAATTVFIAPVVVLFFLVQRMFVERAGSGSREAL